MYDTCLNEHNEHIRSRTGIHQGTLLGKAASRDSGGLRNLTNQEGDQDLMLANYAQVAGCLFFYSVLFRHVKISVNTLIYVVNELSLTNS